MALVKRNWLGQSIESSLLLPAPNKAFFVCVDDSVKGFHQPGQTFPSPLGLFTEDLAATYPALGVH